MRILFILLFFFNYSIYIHAQTTPWFRDDFNSNDQNWPVESSTDVEYMVRDGHYIIINKNENRTINCVRKNIYMDTNKDFTMEAKLKISKSKGDGDAGIFIHNDFGSKYFFCINPYNKSFWIGSLHSNNSYDNFTQSEIGEAKSGWQQTNAFISNTDYQIIKIQQKAKRVYFYINNQEVYARDAGLLITKYIGFITSTKMEVAIDYVFFDQDNWENVLAPNALPAKVIRLPASINTYADEISPVLSADKKTLFFTREGYKENYVSNGQFRDGDIYYSEYKDSTWTEAQRLEFGISNNGNNVAASISPDGNALLLYGEYSSTKSLSNISDGLAISYRLPNGWSYPQNIFIKNFYHSPCHQKPPHYCYISYFLADNNRVLILAMERDDSVGKSDFYVSFKQPDNTWSEPKHMGNTINTQDTDATPYISSDNKTIYFESEGLPGYGGADIYMSKRLDDTWVNWSSPVNLGPAINNDAFNAYYKISTDGSLVYYVSSKNSLGYSDIFMAELPKELRPDPVTLIKGRILDWKTKLPVEASIRYENLGDSSAIGSCRSNRKDGSYGMTLPYGSIYGYYAQANGYISINENIDLQDTGSYKEIYKDIFLIPIEVGQTISLNNIFFVRSKTELLPTSYAELNRLVLLLKNYPTLKIEIRGHTDNQGDEKLNLILSEDRAKTVVNYLIKAGISKSRIKAIGYGSSQTISPNDIEANREKNRRVEFVIIKK